MSSATSPRGTYTAPASYTALYIEYKPMICHLVARSGILSQDVDDVSHAIIEKIIQHDMLADYDPSLLHDTDNGRKRARFNTFLASIVKLYVRHHRASQSKRAIREPAVLDAEETTGERPVAESRALRYGMYTEDGAGHVEGQMLVEEILRSLDDYIPRGQRDLRAALLLAADQVEHEGQINRVEIAQALGVSSSSVSNIFTDLKTELSRRGYSLEAMA